MSLLEKIQQTASPEYATFLADHTDSVSVGDYALLYGMEDIAERNETFEVQKYMPNWLSIGDDGGGNAFLTRLDGTAAVFRCGHGALGSIAPEMVSESFSEWLSDDCPCESEEDD